MTKVKTDRHVYKSQVHAAKAVGRRLGLAGYAGWIYALGYPVAHGWWHYSCQLNRAFVVVQLSRFAWYIDETKLEEEELRLAKFISGRMKEERMSLHRSGRFPK